jgi:hypothetical protein
MTKIEDQETVTDQTLEVEGEGIVLVTEAVKGETVLTAT